MNGGCTIAERIASVIVLLRRDPLTAREIARRLDIDLSTCYRYVRALRDKGLIVRGVQCRYEWAD